MIMYRQRLCVVADAPAEDTYFNSPEMQSKNEEAKTLNPSTPPMTPQIDSSNIDAPSTVPTFPLVNTVDSVLNQVHVMLVRQRGKRVRREQRERGGEKRRGRAWEERKGTERGNSEF